MPRGRGQPSKFNDDVQRQMMEMAKLGLIDKQMAVVLGVTEQTINNWKSAHPDFFEALKSAKSEADSEVERSLFERAKGYTDPDGKNYPPDVVACIFWLKNRQPGRWRDKIEHGHSGEINTSVKVYMPDNGRD